MLNLLVGLVEDDDYPVESSPLLEAYRDVSLVAHGNDRPKVQRLTARFGATLRSLFGTTEIDRRDILKHEVPSGECFDVRWSRTGTVELFFEPSRIVDDPTLMQRVQCLAMMQLWLVGTEFIEVTFLLRDLTPTRCAEILRRSTTAQVRDGINLWMTFPCKFTRIRVFRPRRFWGWTLIESTCMRLLPDAVRRRVEFSST